MADDDAFHALLGLVYDAALNPALWPEVVRRACLALDATTGHFQTIQRSNPAQALLTVPWADDLSRLDPRLLQSYYDYYIVKDLRLQAPSEPWRVYTSDELVERSVLERSEYLADFMSPLGIYHFCGFVTDVRGGVQSTFSVHRSPRQKDFTTDDKAFMARLGPHLVRAAEITTRLGAATHERGLAHALLDHLPYGVILLDEQGRMHTANRVAADILMRADGLTLDRHGRPVAKDAAANAWLRRVIAACLIRPPVCLADLAGSRNVPRDGSLLGYPVMVTPGGMFHPLIPAERGRASVVVLIGDLTRSAKIRPEILQRLYELTPTEARLATHIGDGLALRETADRMGLTVGSARVTLKRVFAKTDTHRQSELVRLVLLTPGYATPEHGGPDNAAPLVEKSPAAWT